MEVRFEQIVYEQTMSDGTVDFIALAVLLKENFWGKWVKHKTYYIAQYGRSYYMQKEHTVKIAKFKTINEAKEVLDKCIREYIKDRETKRVVSRRRVL